MKNISLEKVFVLLFVLALLISSTAKTPAQKELTEVKSTVDSVIIAVSRKQAKPSYDTSKKMNVIYTLQVSDFDTMRGIGADSNKLVLIPKSIKLLNQITLPPVKKK